MTNEELAELERDIKASPFAVGWKVPIDQLQALIATAREAEALRAENARLRSEGQWAIDTLEELNPSNYDHDDACRVNAASVEVILGLRFALEQGEAAILRAERNEP